MILTALSLLLEYQLIINPALSLNEQARLIVLGNAMLSDNFRMKYRYGRYGATYDMVALSMNFRVIEQNFRCCQRIQQRQSYKLRVHGMNPQSPLMV